MPRSSICITLQYAEGGRFSSKSKILIRLVEKLDLADWSWYYHILNYKCQFRTYGKFLARRLLNVKSRVLIPLLSDVDGWVNHVSPICLMELPPPHPPIALMVPLWFGKGFSLIHVFPGFDKSIWIGTEACVDVLPLGVHSCTLSFLEIAIQNLSGK